MMNSISLARNVISSGFQELRAKAAGKIMMCLATNTIILSIQNKSFIEKVKYAYIPITRNNNISPLPPVRQSINTNKLIQPGLQPVLLLSLEDLNPSLVQRNMQLT